MSVLVLVIGLAPQADAVSPDGQIPRSTMSTPPIFGDIYTVTPVNMLKNRFFDLAQQIW
jgi:hypothetical protein